MKTTITTTDHNAQAEAFLRNSGVKMSVSYFGYGPHFAGDTDSRHRYRVTFSRNGKRMRVMFGQSIAAGATEPSAYDVLSCLQKYDVGTFDDFCHEFGYSEDSRNSERIYKDILRECEGIARVFPQDDNSVEAFREIQ
jgi:hypothetical protein